MDIVEKINSACVGHPHALIPWPHHLLHDAVNEIQRLRAELEECRRDAERYRWLREKIENDDFLIARVSDWGFTSWCGDDPDRYIDAVLAADGALREGGEQMEFECAPRWRDVADELPREAQEVLFVRGEKTVFGAWIGGIFWHNNQKMAAAYWMPIPKAPVQRGSK